MTVLALAPHQNELSKHIPRNYPMANEQRLAELENKIAGLNSSLIAHDKNARQFESTLRNLDNSVKALTIQLERAKLEDYKEMNKVVDPLYNRVRETEKRQNIITGVVIAGSLIGATVIALSVYIFLDLKDSVHEHLEKHVPVATVEKTP